MSGWVTVTGPPSAICLRKMGTTLPLLPSTLPKRTAMNLVLLVTPMLCTTISAVRLLMPMADTGFTALSVEIITKRFTPCLSATLATFLVPNTLFVSASSGFSSMRGTCL
ncbi:MAG: hypothetical protein BWY85_01747 [Firmicutes bacterium ADurb.Bin506]|nr:MAG: hypothetical protein BWY85_01747 [Firmicutes bacterium ADurb.Bin506]